MECQKELVSISGKMEALSREISSKVRETAMEFGKLIMAG